MSRDITLFQPSNLPAAPDDLWHSTSSLGPAGPGAPPPPSPMKKLHRLLRGRWGLAITLCVIGALVGGVGGWISQKPKYASTGLIWIKPNIPNLYNSDKVMPFYTLYVQGQAAMVGNQRILEKAIQSEEWRATGLPANDDMIAMLKDNLDVQYTKNTQHIQVVYTDPRMDVAQAAVKSVIHAYAALYTDVNGQEMHDKLLRMEQK